MVSTYRLMSQVLLDENKKYTNEELAVMYQRKKDPSVLAEIYCRNFPQWVHMVNKPKFYNILNDDKVSIVLCELDKALLHFDISKGFKFTTFANKFIAMGLYNKLEHVNRKNNAKLVQFVSSSEFEESDIGVLVDDTIEELQYAEDRYSDIELKATIQMSNMREREKEICFIILDNPGITDIEIAGMLKVHRHTVSTIKHGMQQKLNFLCT